MATSSKIVFSRDELDLIVELAGCSLDESPGKNWVESNGGLPEYICRIARAIKKTGKTTSQAISIAVSRVKKWAAGADGVDADTRAKAATALAQWEKLKAKNKARNAKKDVKATAQGEFLLLTTTFNVDTVRRAWREQTDQWRTKWQTANPNASYSDGPAYSYIKEMWTTYLIVESDSADGEKLHKVDYEVNDDGTVTFADPIPVRTEYVVIDEQEAFGEQLDNTELRTLMASVGPCYQSNTDQVLLTIGSRPSALEQVLGSYKPTPSATQSVLAVKLGAPRSALKSVLGE